MEIGATKVVQDRLKTTKIEESAGASLVFCWDTHLTKIKGRNVLFIVNASNRYTWRRYPVLLHPSVFLLNQTISADNHRDG